ncbi:hypothetical protein F8154_04635 [Alkaliphilus pronyensis]|uniref:Uncharacterized protein n=1 Tax=Alkaliphilus pronyensis TaxID=1482732 RepID=A0A6I0FE38_9FIRM|nr:hypothetical protein [Alkaliphilus pronyensis]KAB3536050.1 hypothetical protein F8154_04635 [Alkaliphilus pronyensis]
MNKFISLTKIQVFDFFSKYTQHLNLNNRWLKKLAILIPVLLIIPAFNLALSIYKVFSSIGIPELTITYMYIGNVMMIFFACIPLIISNFFYSKDLMFIASLPLKEESIIFSKLASVYLYLLAIACLFFGTAVIAYGIIGGIQPLPLIIGIIALIMSPLIPMLLATLVIIPFMSIIAGGKRRNLMAIGGNILLLMLILLIQITLTRVEIDPEGFTNLMLQEDGLLKLIGRGFPPSIWLTKMIQGSFLYGGLFILLHIILLYALKLMSHFLYNRALMSFNQSDGGVISNNNIYYKSRSRGFQLIKRHILIIFSNPVFTLNTVLTMLVPILMFIIMSFTGQLNNEIFRSEAIAPYLIYLYAGIVTTPAIIGNLSATVITREGKTFWETRVLPITTAENIRYRVYSTLIISFIGSIILALAAAAYLPISLDMMGIGLLFCITATLLFSTIDIAINIERPILNWTSPTTAVKNNLNVMISLVVRLVIGGAFYILYGLMPNYSGHTILLIYSLISIVLFIAVYYVITRWYIDKFDSIIY